VSTKCQDFELASTPPKPTTCKTRVEICEFEVLSVVQRRVPNTRNPTSNHRTKFEAERVSDSSTLSRSTNSSKHR